MQEKDKNIFTILPVVEVSYGGIRTWDLRVVHLPIPTYLTRSNDIQYSQVFYACILCINLSYFPAYFLIKNFLNKISYLTIFYEVDFMTD